MAVARMVMLSPAAQQILATQCVNLQVTVPSTIAAGDYLATIQYNLYAN